MRVHSLTWFAIIMLVLSSCSIELNQPTASSPSPQTSSGSPQASAVPSTQIPVTWGSLNLKGRLIYINGAYSGEVFSLQIQALNLVTGEITTIFDAPKYSWIHYITISPDATQLIMSYSPPSESGPTDPNLYILPLDGAQPPKLLFKPPTNEDAYMEVEWSPDGQYVYFTHVNPHIPPQPGQIYPLYEIYRIKYPDGKPEKIAEKAYWPRLSPDSAKIAYVSVDLFERGNKLFVADADGRNAKEVVLQGPSVPDIQDAPIFSSDGKSILFSGPDPALSYRPGWLDKLTGVIVAKAHSNVPSDWWSVPVAGGKITKLTNIQAAGLFGSLAPDGGHLASYSLNGIFVMKPDGSELTTLVQNPAAIPGTVSWIP